ncbi:hypothetical protein [Caballeronia arationis]|jgi:hypothetical protein|nr:hypothetical protein [Caballeronia arationis]
MHDFTDARSNQHAQSRQPGGEPMAHYGSEGAPNHGIIDNSNPA